MDAEGLTSNKQSSTKIRICKGCELPVAVENVSVGKSAYCPRCNMKLYKGGTQLLIGNLAIAVTCLLLFIPSHFFPFISIRLIGVMIPATLPSGTLTLMQEGFVGLGLLILFCSSIAPLLVSLSVILTHIALRYRWFASLKYALLVIQFLKQWMMLDVFLVSVAISCFKLQDYSDIFVGVGLYGIILLQLFSLMLISRVNVRHYWEAWYKESDFSFKNKTIHCGHCHLSQPFSKHCQRCHTTLHHRKPNSIQKTWALLIAASAFIFPANILPISILFNNGQRIEDTIFSGIAYLIVTDKYGIALVIFVASIVVPVAKIVGLGYILFSIQFKQKILKKQRMFIYFVVKWIGKWSVMDLFVISIMMTLVDRGQILNFTPGFGAVAFGAVVVLTMLATDSFDPRLIWDKVPTSSARQDEDYPIEHNPELNPNVTDREG
jgi:paraquat-inducible protein A